MARTWWGTGPVSKSGSWFSYGDLRMGQGKENAKEFLKENQDVAQEIEARLRVALNMTPPEEEGGREGEREGDDSPAAEEDGGDL